MSASLIAIRTSFRPNSNSSRLLEKALEGAASAGASVEVVELARTTIGPCRACDACARTGRCVFADDDLLALLDKVMSSGRLLIATPIYYMAAPAQLKLFIDRTQCLYNMKYTLKKRLPPDQVARRRGGVIAVCGSKLKNAFDGLDLTMRYLFDSLQMGFAEKLYVRHVDKQGEIDRHPERLAEARELGRRLAAG